MLASAVLLIVGVSVIVVAADEATRRGFVSQLTGDFAQYGAALLGLLLIRLAVRVAGGRTVGRIFIAALACLFVSGLLNVTNDIPLFAGWPLLGAGDSFNALVKDACELASIVLVLLALVVAILSASKARDDLLRAHERHLAEAVRRTRAEGQTRAETEFTDTALDAQLDTFFLFDPAAGKALRWNRAFGDMSGYSDEEIGRMPAPDSYYSPQDLKRAEGFIQKVLERGTGTIELELVCKDGRRIPTEYRVSVIKNDREEPEYIISIGRDITARKRTEEALRQRASELVALNDFGRAVTATLSLGETSNAALEGILSAMHPDMAFLFLRDGERLLLSGVMPVTAGARLGDIPEHRVGECICGLAVREKRSLFSSDIHTDRRCTWEECKRAGIKSFAAIPLMRRGEAIGVMGLASYTERDYEQEAGFLETLTGQVSVALINAQLYETAQQELAERQRAEEDVNAHASFLDTVMDQSPFAMWISDSTGMVLRTNRALREALNLSDEQISGKYNVLQDGNLADQGVMPRVRAVFEEQKPARFIIPWLAVKAGDIAFEKGRDLWIDVSMFPILDRGKNLANVVCQWVDITERRRAEEALRESERRLKHIASVTTDLVHVWNLADDALEWYGGLDAALGYELGEIARTAQGWLDLIHPDDVERLAESVKLHRESATPTREIYRVRRKDGSWVWWEDFGTPVMDDSGKPVQWIGACRDITRERDLEEQYRQAQKMEAIGQLTGGVAHDFNNLLQVINGGTEMAMQDLEAGHPARESLADVAKAGERAARLVSQLLLFSRRQIMQPEFLDLNETVTNLIKMLGRVIGEHIQLQWHPGTHAGTIHADRGMVEQALMNLCVNARDAMPGGGRLTIETGAVVIDDHYCTTHSWAKPGRYGVLCVSDTGCGIDQETLEHIFEPFFTTKATGKGTGLGLATVYGIVRQHDGMIDAYSEPGSGAAFKLYWPLHGDARATVSRSAVEVEFRGGMETILLVEDDERVRHLARTMLERAGYRVLTAGDGAEAVALFKERGEDVEMAILDVVMPKMGGREAYEQMQALRPGLRALFASGYNEDSIHTGFVLDEGLSFVQKPFTRQALLYAVRETLDKPEG
jgi:PAS domain S-box-containing protein